VSSPPWALSARICSQHIIDILPVRSVHPPARLPANLARPNGLFTGHCQRFSPAEALSIFFFDVPKASWNTQTPAGATMLTEPLESACSVRSGGVSCNYSDSGGLTLARPLTAGRATCGHLRAGRGNCRRVATRWRPWARPVIPFTWPLSVNTLRGFPGSCEIVGP